MDLVYMRRATGSERRILANATEATAGNALQKCINRVTNIRMAALDQMRFDDLELLEEVFVFFTSTGRVGTAT